MCGVTGLGVILVFLGAEGAEADLAVAPAAVAIGLARFDRRADDDTLANDQGPRPNDLDVAPERCP